MDGHRFDDLSRTVATGITRRGALRSIAAGLLAALGLRHGAGAQVSLPQCGNVVCASKPGKCKSGCVCCVFPNGNSRCSPPGFCPLGTVVCLPGQVRQGQGCATTTTSTTTTTTSAPPTTTTTTTNPPSQGTCLTGQDFCTGDYVFCNGSQRCACATTTSGATVCRGDGAGSGCQFDSDCDVIAGTTGLLCIRSGPLCTGGENATVCAPPCPTSL